MSGTDATCGLGSPPKVPAETLHGAEGVLRLLHTFVSRHRAAITKTLSTHRMMALTWAMTANDRNAY